MVSFEVVSLEVGKTRVGLGMLIALVRWVSHRGGGVNMGGHNIVRVDKRMLEAGVMAAEGATANDIAKHYGVHPNTVRAWLKNSEVQEEIKGALRQRLVPMVVKAVNVIDKQMDSTKANGFLAQNAANTTLSKYGAHLLEDDEKELTVTFVNGMVPIGLPDGPVDDYES